MNIDNLTIDYPFIHPMVNGKYVTETKTELSHKYEKLNNVLHNDHLCISIFGFMLKSVRSNVKYLLEWHQVNAKND